MTTDDIRNLELRLARQGDADAAHKVGVLLEAFVMACEDVAEGEDEGEWEQLYLTRAEQDATGRIA